MTRETWRVVTGWEDYYEVSSQGRVRSLDRIVYQKNGVNRRIKGRIIKQHYTTNGYPFVHISANGTDGVLLVHRMVGDAFISNPYKFTQINHKDLNKSNNSVDNLEWCTPAQNMAHARANNAIKTLSGSESPVARRVIVFYNNGDLFCRTHTVIEASRITGVDARRISDMAKRGVRNSKYGFIFKYE